MSDHIQPDAWGVHTLEIDRAALAEGTLRVMRLDSMLPGGTFVPHPRAACLLSSSCTNPGM